MNLLLNTLAKSHIFYPLRKTALFISKRWPFPVRTLLIDKTEMWVDLRSAVGRAILVKGMFDYEIWNIIRSKLAPGSVFVDVGANVGYYSMLASNLVGPFGRVHAFDIDPRPLKCLRRNRNICNNKNMEIHETAVGDDVGAGYLLAMPDCGHSAVHKTGSGRKVPMLSLDSWLKSLDEKARIDVIKIDVEGGELAVLEGARNLISTFQPLIVCEAQSDGASVLSVSQKELLNFFADVNYLTYFADGVHTPTIVAMPNT